MRYPFTGIRILLFALVTILVPPIALADDEDEVLAVVQSWAELENDLDKQAELIRDDRVQIFEMLRQTDQAQNLRIQLAQQAARRKVDPDVYAIVTIESPIVRIYGNTAVVSFIRLFNVIPGNAPPGPPVESSITLVLVNERGDWKIAHLHGSTA